MRDEDEARAEAQEQRGEIDGESLHVQSRAAGRSLKRLLERYVTPVVLFGTAYLATFFLLRALRFPLMQWVGLMSAAVATTFVVVVWERGRWDIGLARPAALVVLRLAAGAAFAALVILAVDVGVRAAVPWSRTLGGGLPWRELLAVYIPAALHEELVFRGYPYQKWRQGSRLVAVLAFSALFAALHAGNDGITAVAFLNIFLGGVLLALAYEWREELWFPIGLHLTWNLMLGPVLGYAVSGFVSDSTVLATSVSGNPLVTGGAFGLEASLVMTAAECVAITVLLVALRRFPVKNGRTSPRVL